LPLQDIRLSIGPADEHHISIESLDVSRRDFQIELRMRDALPLRGQQLDQIFPLAGRPEAGDDLLRVVRPVDLHRGADHGTGKRSDNRIDCGLTDYWASDRFGARAGAGWCALARRHEHLLAVTPRPTCDGHVGDAAAQHRSRNGSHCQESTLKNHSTRKCPTGHIDRHIVRHTALA
jgi:hypothetical protein